MDDAALLFAAKGLDPDHVETAAPSEAIIRLRAAFLALSLVEQRAIHRAVTGHVNVAVIAAETGDDPAVIRSAMSSGLNALHRALVAESATSVE